MEKLISLAFIIAGGLVHAQTNTLPTNGDCGIGTLTPTAKLDVNGNMKIDSCLLVKDTLFVENDVRVGEDLKVNGDLYLPNLTLDNSFDGEFLWTDSNGQVKKGDGNSLLELVYTKDCDNNPNPNPTWSNGLDKIFYACPIRVGIGTDSPATALHVVGGTLTGNVTIGDENDLSIPGRFVIKTHNLITSPTPIINIHNVDHEVLRLDQDGLLRAREIKVDAAVWPDYVFEKSYQLMPLELVEKHIMDNGHLPNIPSAETMLEEGLNVAEMDKLLLEKIEELTLHLIAQEKRISELELQIQEQK